MANLLKKSDKFILANRCDEATTLLVGAKFDNLPMQCQDKPIFATSYRYYKKNLQVFGAFYWRKGRPQLRFKSDRLSKFNLDLPKELRKYEQN